MINLFHLKVFIIFILYALFSHQTVCTKTHVHETEVEWTVSESYPKNLQQVVRWKPLIGGEQSDWAGIPHKDIYFGTLELAPGAIYPGHSHVAPELYYVVSGKAEWTVGDDTFIAEQGTSIYHPPNMLHKMINIGNQNLKTVYLWWAPSGDRSVLNSPVKLLEPIPKQPESAKFK